MPSDHKHVLATFHQADEKTTEAAVEAALKAKVRDVSVRLMFIFMLAEEENAFPLSPDYMLMLLSQPTVSEAWLSPL